MPQQMTVKEASEIILWQVDMRDKPAMFPPFILGILVQIVTKLILKYGPILLDKILNGKSLNICDRWAVKRIVKNCCPTSQDYNEYGQILIDAVLKSVTEFSPNQIRSLMENVKENGD